MSGAPDFSFSGYFNSADKQLTYSPTFIETKCNYGLTANWSHKGLFVEVGCSRLFENKPFYKIYFDYSAYKFNTRDFSDGLGKSVYVKLSYNFDFGRKIEHKNIDADVTKASSIMKL